MKAKTEERLAGCIYWLLVVPLHALIEGWIFMLAVGIAHTYWIPALPTIGYWWAVLIVFLLTGTFSRIRSYKEVSRP